MSWENQGRQEHGWFGHGQAPEQPRNAADRALFSASGLGDRLHAVASSVIAALPPALRRRAESQLAAGGLPRLIQAMAAWNEGALLPASAFADFFFGRAADDTVALKAKH